MGLILLKYFINDMIYANIKGYLNQKPYKPHTEVCVKSLFHNFVGLILLKHLIKGIIYVYNKMIFKSETI